MASIVAACAGVGPSGTASPSPASPLAPSVAPTPAAPLTVFEYVSASPTPNDASDVAIRGWLGRLPAMGWEAPYIEPSWLAYPPDHPNVALWQRGPGGDAMCGGATDCAFLVLHLPPGSSVELGDVARWVDVVGHRNDPVAATCHYVFDGSWAGPTPANASAVDECRTQFVVVELRDARMP